MPELIKEDGGVIHYEVSGSGERPAVVLIEGLSAHILGWRKDFYQQFLDAGFQVIRFDNRDVGLSEHYPGQRYGLRDMARDVHELIEHLGATPAHVVGQSMGGMIAQHLAINWPEDVASLALIYTAASTTHIAGAGDGLDLLVDVPRASTREEAIEMHVERERVCASPGFSFDEAWKRELGGLMWDRAYDPDGVVRQARAMIHDPVDLDDLASVAVPTLVLHGTGDRLIDFSGSLELHGSIPRSELWLIEGMGHDLPRELWPDLAGRIITNAVGATPATERLDA